MAVNWEDRIRGIAAGLLTLEVNTIEKPNMSAAKMPDVPMALHQLVALYVGELEGRKFFITDDLLAAGAARLEQPNDPARLQRLQNWPFATNDRGSEALTNGARTFEAIAWAAVAARRQLDDVGAPQATDPVSLAVAADRALLQRLIVNCRQLREVALLLKQQFPGQTELFDGTIEQTTGKLFRHPRPVLDIDADLVVLIRKAWDIGLETVLFQTAMQVDGDVLVRVAPGMDEVRRAFYGELHRATVETGIKQWRGLFDLVATLVSGLGAALFGPRS